VVEKREKARLALEESRGRLATLDADLERVKREQEQRNAQLVGQIEKTIELDFEQEDLSRTIFHSQRTRQSLEKFRTAVTRRHVSRIEQLVFDSLKRLLRKESLISDLRIDPERFSIELRGKNGKSLSPDRLSAGERQLLAVSLLWGLARAAGRPLPAIIDTPLGRLDASHRDYLVERYFPQASHQVLLLSTDEEINKKYYEKLKPWVGHTYSLKFDDATSATHIEPGYFW
jgi:DNA sulfur modification protein DndD